MPSYASSIGPARDGAPLGDPSGAPSGFVAALVGLEHVAGAVLAGEVAVPVGQLREVGIRGRPAMKRVLELLGPVALERIDVLPAVRVERVGLSQELQPPSTSSPSGTSTARRPWHRLLLGGSG